jgi:hypothetical protein
MDQIHDCGGVAEMYLVGEERGRAGRVGERNRREKGGDE